MERGQNGLKYSVINKKANMSNIYDASNPRAFGYMKADSQADTDEDFNPQLSLSNGIGILSITKRTNGEAQGVCTTAHVGVNIAVSMNVATPLGISLWGLPSTNIVTVTLQSGPPNTIRFAFADGDVVDVKVTEPSGSLMAEVPNGNNTVYDLEIGYTGHLYG